MMSSPSNQFFDYIKNWVLSHIRHPEKFAEIDTVLSELYKKEAISKNELIELEIIFEEKNICLKDNFYTLYTINIVNNE